MHNLITACFVNAPSRDSDFFLSKTKKWAQHFPRVKTGTIGILCSRGLEVCCAMGKRVSAGRRHGEEMLKEPCVFSLAECRLGSDMVHAEYPRGDGCYRARWLVSYTERTVRAQEYSGNAQVWKWMQFVEKRRLCWPAEEGGSRAAFQNQRQGHKVMSLVFSERTSITQFCGKMLIGVYNLACPLPSCKSTSHLKIHLIMAHANL